MALSLSQEMCHLIRDGVNCDNMRRESCARCIEAGVPGTCRYLILECEQETTTGGSICSCLKNAWHTVGSHQVSAESRNTNHIPQSPSGDRTTIMGGGGIGGTIWRSDRETRSGQSPEGIGREHTHTHTRAHTHVRAHTHTHIHTMA